MPWLKQTKQEALKAIEKTAETQKKDNARILKEVAKDKFRVGKSNKAFGRGPVIGYNGGVFKETLWHFIVRKLKGY